MHRDSEEYRNTVEMIRFFRKALDEAERDHGQSGVHVLIARGDMRTFALQDPVVKDVAEGTSMSFGTATATFMRAVAAGLIGAEWSSAGPHATTTGAYVTHITPEGLAMLESWEEPSPPQSPVFNIYGDTYGSNVGTQQHAQVIRPTFTFGDLEREIERRGGQDVEALKAMVREIRETLERQDSLSRGWLLRWGELINRHAGWIAEPIAQLLLLYAVTGQVGSGA